MINDLVLLLLQVARDPSGCRVLEALLQGEAAATAKRQLLSKLSGCYADVALLASGSYLVEKAFAWAVSYFVCYFLVHLLMIYVFVFNCKSEDGGWLNHRQVS